MFVQPCTLAVLSPLLQAVWDAVAVDVVSLYERLSAACVPGPHLDQLHDRALKHLLLSIIVAGAATPSVFTSRVPSPVTATVNVRAPACLLCVPEHYRLFFVQGRIVVARAGVGLGDGVCIVVARCPQGCLRTCRAA